MGREMGLSHILSDTKNLSRDLFLYLTEITYFLDLPRQFDG